MTDQLRERLLSRLPSEVRWEVGFPRDAPWAFGFSAARIFPTKLLDFQIVLGENFRLPRYGEIPDPVTERPRFSQLD
jgi:hypothetical protein